GRPGRPGAVGAVLDHADHRRRREGITPVRDRARRRVASELAVAVANEPEGVLVEAHPEVKTVLLDPVGRSSSGRALAAETPAELIHGHLVTSRVLRTGQLERGRDRGAAAAHDGDLYGAARHSRSWRDTPGKPSTKSGPNMRAGVWKPGSR